MPLSKHYGGSGAKVMRNMKEEYGEEEGERVFYATENARKKGKKGKPHRKTPKSKRRPAATSFLRGAGMY